MNISLLGSTGSIGRQTADVARMQGYNIVAVAADKNYMEVENQIREFHPAFAAMRDERAARELRARVADTPTAVYGGESAVCEAAAHTDADVTVNAVVGIAGLAPTMAAVNNGKKIALANKETLVMAGDIVMARAKETGTKILPVDSEHGAIHQCLSNRTEVEKLIITASGGPFRNKTVEDMKNATVEETLHHPRWNMGKKITIDSATLMNKGLEVIEAHHLFNMSYDKIQVVIHPQSIVHSAVEYIDGSVIAQLGFPSMHIPIQYALTYPQRFSGIETRSFDFIKAGRLDFEAPDLEKFPCLKLAFEAGKQGGTMPAVMNAANEEAVFMFLNKKISLWNIYEITKKITEKHENIKNPSLDEILEQDRIAREEVKNLQNI